MKGHTGTRAQEFVVRGFVAVRKPTLPADIVDQNRSVFGLAAYNTLQQGAEGFATLQNDPAPAGVGVGLDDRKAVSVSIFLDR